MAPELLLLGVVFLAITAYLLLGGADFGAGVWELATGLQAGRKERALSYRSIGPVWEANHVWLIFVLATLWTAFPPAFAALCRALWLPLLLALVGIVFRGAAYAFRSYAVDADQRHFWEVVFAGASTLAPFFLGAAAGAVAHGELDVRPDGSYAGSVLAGWVSLTSLFAGCFTVSSCAHLAAVYLTREADLAGERALTDLWRRRALGAGAAMGALAMAGLVVVAFDAPSLWEGFKARAWPLIGVSALGGFGSLAALIRRRYVLAMAGAAIALGAVVWGWALAQYPLLVPKTITVEAAKAPDAALWFMLGTILAGFLLLAPALGYLLWLFKSEPEPLE